MAAITPVPTAAQFKSRFPIFGAVTKETIDEVIAEAMQSVDDTWIEGDRISALFYLTAHLLVREGALAASAAAAGVVITRGPVTSVRVGDVSTTYASTSSSESGGATGTGGDPLLTTEYGRRFAILQRRSFPAVLVV